MSERKKFIVVYKILNLLNNYEYVGVHRTNKIDDSYMGSGKRIIRAIKKYGKENFTKEILYCYDNDIEGKGEKEAFKREGEIVTIEYTLRENTYNMSVGGHINPVMCGENNPWYGKKIPEHVIEERQKSRGTYVVSEETKRKNSEALKEKWKDEEYREKVLSHLNERTHSEETKEKISKAHKGRKHSEEHNKNLSISKKNAFKDEEYKKRVMEKSITPERNKKLSESLKGKKRSEEVVNRVNKNPEKIRKTAEKHRGMKRSEESKKKMSEAAKGRTPWNKGKKGLVEKTKCIHNNELRVNKLVPLDHVLEEGWEYGRAKFS